MKYMIALLVLTVGNLAYGADDYKTFLGKIAKGEKGVLVIHPDKQSVSAVSGVTGLVGVATAFDVDDEVAGVYDCYRENGKVMMNRRSPPVVVTAPQYLFPLLRSACQNGNCPK